MKRTATGLAAPPLPYPMLPRDAADGIVAAGSLCPNHAVRTDWRTDLCVRVGARQFDPSIGSAIIPKG